MLWRRFYGLSVRKCIKCRNGTPCLNTQVEYSKVWWMIWVFSANLWKGLSFFFFFLTLVASYFSACYHCFMLESFLQSMSLFRSRSSDHLDISSKSKICREAFLCCCKCTCSGLKEKCPLETHVFQQFAPKLVVVFWRYNLPVKSVTGAQLCAHLSSLPCFVFEAEVVISNLSAFATMPANCSYAFLP